MDDGGETTSREFRDRVILGDFISECIRSSELWDVRCEEYSNRDKNNSAYKNLLVYYKLLKNDSTIEEVKKKKKINTLRSNFRKELRKINDSKRSGAGINDVYRPSSWLFEELSLLTDLEKPIKSVCYSINN
jgi:hypothetical protein